MKVYEFFKSHGPAAWCQGQSAIGEDGRWAGYDSPKAVAWCLAGRIWVEYGNDHKRVERRVFDLLGRRESVAEYNDTHAFEEVLEFCLVNGI